MSHEIPIIDLTDYLAGQPGALQETARDIHEALTHVGFFVITGHDVPAALIDQTFGEAVRLHDLPMARKLVLLHPCAAGLVGYKPWHDKTATSTPSTARSGFQRQAVHR